MSKYLTLGLSALAAVVFTLSPLTLAGQSRQTTLQTIVGEVTDTMCAPSKSHSNMMTTMSKMGHDAASCTRECAKIGAKYVLLDNQTGKVYHVDDQTRIAQFAGHRVEITGMLTASGIKVTNINLIG